jgi:hypothetical protein
MYTVDLDSQPEYRALSYEWGSSTPTVTIQCNDSNFEVTTNLAAALHRLRKLDGPKIFWIDALCINQKDLEERNQQVAQMGRIYSQVRGECSILHADDPSTLKYILTCPRQSP